ncbi:hypothetical protein P9112_002507 [Eukaryota sp. TZLM1-RC]
MSTFVETSPMDHLSITPTPAVTKQRIFNYPMRPPASIRSKYPANASTVEPSPLSRVSDRGPSSVGFLPHTPASKGMLQYPFQTPPSIARSDISDDECHGCLDVLDPRTLAVVDHHFIFHLPYKIGSSLTNNLIIKSDNSIVDCHAEIVADPDGRLVLLPLEDCHFYSLGQLFSGHDSCELVDNLVFLIGDTPVRFSVPEPCHLPPMLTPSSAPVAALKLMPKVYSPIAKLLSFEETVDPRCAQPLELPPDLVRMALLLSASRKRETQPRPINPDFDRFVAEPTCRSNFLPPLNKMEWKELKGQAMQIGSFEIEQSTPQSMLGTNQVEFPHDELPALKPLEPSSLSPLPSKPFLITTEVDTMTPERVEFLDKATGRSSSSKLSVKFIGSLSLGVSSNQSIQHLPSCTIQAPPARDSQSQCILELNEQGLQTDVTNLESKEINTEFTTPSTTDAEVQASMTVQPIMQSFLDTNLAEGSFDVENSMNPFTSDLTTKSANTLGKIDLETIPVTCDKTEDVEKHLAMVERPTTVKDSMKASDNITVNGTIGKDFNEQEQATEVVEEYYEEVTEEETQESESEDETSVSDNVRAESPPPKKPPKRGRPPKFAQTSPPVTRVRARKAVQSTASKDSKEGETQPVKKRGRGRPKVIKNPNLEAQTQLSKSRKRSSSSAIQDVEPKCKSTRYRLRSTDSPFSPIKTTRATRGRRRQTN